MIPSTSTFSYKSVKWPGNRIIVNCLCSTTTFRVRNKSGTFGAMVTNINYPACNKFTLRKSNFTNSVKYWYRDGDLRTVLDSKVSRNSYCTTNIQEFWMQRFVIFILQKWYILTSQLHFQLLTFLWYCHMNPPVTGHQTNLKTERCAIWTVVKEIQQKNCL